MRHLLATTCFAALAAWSATPALAETVNNQTTISSSNTNGAVGINVVGPTGSITNASAGKITIDETYTPTDSDNDGDLDGPFATGSGRYGIRTTTPFTGPIVNNGTITIEGNDSYGIGLGAALSGKLVTDGTITVTGDRAIGVRTSDITGPVRIAGTVGVKGKDAMGVSIEGNISGALEIQGGLASTGYRTTTPPSDVSKLDADDLLQGGPALNIAGDISGGVILAVPPKNTSSTDTDVDDDGIDDSKEGSAAVASYGAAPAIRIGSATRSVTIGPVAGTANGHGLIIDGTVLGSGVYANVDGNGIVIGGLGNSVSIAGGMTVNGQVQAQSNGANATAIRVGAAATVPEIRNAGAIDASGKNATGIAVDAGGSVTAVRNSALIRATASSGAGSATAIVDHSGTLVTVDNAGTITATGATAGSGRNIAIDLSVNTSGATVRQTAVAADVTAPSITGDIKLGSGNDLLDIADGQFTGQAIFGDGNNSFALSGDAIASGGATFGAGNDSMTLAGGTRYTGTVDFGGGTDTLTLSGTAYFSGSFANSGGLGVALNGGTLDLAKGTIALRSLSIGSSGVLGVTLDSSNHSSTLFQVSDDASFAAGAKIKVTLTGLASAEGRYTFLQAGTVTGTANLATADSVLPYMFKSSIVATAPTTLAIDITRKTTTELGLNRSQATAYNAIYQALTKDAEVAGVFLNTVDGDTFRKQVRAMLPDHAGGTFEMVTMGSRALSGFLADPTAPYVDKGGWAFRMLQAGWGRTKSLGDTAAYDVSGWGIGGAGEIKTKMGAFGLSLAYLFGTDDDGGTPNKVDAKQIEASLYWHGSWGGLSAWAKGAIGQIDFTGKRTFSGTIGTQTIERHARGSWNGRLMSAAGGASYEMYFGAFSLRPVLAFDYYRMREGGYTETGGGDAFNLTVSRRTSDEFAVSGTVAAGIEFGGEDDDSGWLRLELEGGRRELVGGSLGLTTAHFAGGQNFTLVPEDRDSGWVGKVRAIGGGPAFTVAGEAGAEQQQGHAAFSLRASLSIGF